ncbi:MAG: hemolysin family protein [Erysipelotrichaceae bacterium]|nr:hemolysin family protein [Erysipelotrichaceae bacterium]
MSQLEIINYVVPIVVIAVSIVFSTFFSSADMAYGVADIDKLEKRAEKSKSAKLALKLTSNYEFTISTILFGNNLANISASAFAVILGTRIAGNNPVGGTIATVLLTVFVILFCEFLPKAITKRFATRFAEIYAYPIKIMEIVFFIFVWPVSKLFTSIGKLLQKKKKEEDTIDDEVLQKMIDESEDKGVLEEGEAELVRSTIDLNDTEAYEIMTPRVDVFSIDVSDKVEELMNNPKLYDYSRIPVYEDTVDNIIGILPVKTLLKHVIKGEKDINIRDLLYKPLFIPRNTEVLSLLDQFKADKIHIAVVIDEYGGTDGIVTMEDILELIVGDIFDETDEVEEEVEDEGNGTFIIDGTMNIDDFLDLIDYKKDVDTSYTTVGGFCQEFIEGFAKVGDQFDFGGYHFTVLEADDFSVEKIRVSKIVVIDD